MFGTQVLVSGLRFEGAADDHSLRVEGLPNLLVQGVLGVSVLYRESQNNQTTM